MFDTFIVKLKKSPPPQKKVCYEIDDFLYIGISDEVLLIKNQTYYNQDTFQKKISEEI